MRIILPVFVALSAAATAPALKSTAQRIDSADPIVNTRASGIVPIGFVQSAVLKDRLQTWDDSSERLTHVQEELEVIVAKVIRMKPDEMEVLDPVLLELFEKKEQLIRAVDAGRDGSKKGFLSSPDDIKSLQDYLELEIKALEDAVNYLRVALEEYNSSSKMEI